MQSDGTASRYEGGAGKSVPPIALVAAGGTLLVDDVEALPPRVLLALLTAAEAPGGPALVASSSLPPSALHESIGAALVTRFAHLATLPPLRARAADVLPLAEILASRIAGRPILIAPGAREALSARRWTGNVAELTSVIAAALARLPRGADELTLAAFPTDDAAARRADLAFPQTLEAVERAHVAGALDACGWQEAAAAVTLGVPVPTLRALIARHGLEPPGR